MLVLGQVPFAELPHRYDNALRKFIVAKYFSNQSIGVQASKEAVEANRSVERIISDINNERLIYIDPVALFTSADGGLRLVDGSGSFLFSDQHHINDAGAELLFNAQIQSHFRGKVNGAEGK